MKTIVIGIWIIISSLTSAQTKADSIYQLEITVTASPTFNFFRYDRYPGVKDKTTFGSGIFLRTMWHPGRLLAIGFMTGYTRIAKDKFIVDNAFSDELGSEASASLSAIPLQVGVSMQSSEIEMGLGMGPYLMLSSIYFGRLSEGRRIELGITFFGSYRFALNEDIYIGPELRFLYLSYRGIISVMPSLSIRLETLRY